MSGTADDDDYYVPPGTKIITTYGPDGPSTQPVCGETCSRQTKEHDAEILGHVLAAERKIYEMSLARSGLGRGAIPSHLHQNSTDSGDADIVELTIDDILPEDE